MRGRYLKGGADIVTLITHTPNPEHVVADAARVCYNSHSTDDARLIRSLLRRGHLSPFEHVSFTFEIADVSRALLAQITRHRIASFSVQSQRYVKHDGFDYVVPLSIQALGAERRERFRAQMAQIDEWYRGWLERGIPKEDARFVLPNAATTRMVVTMNARELMHFFGLRCAPDAQWEIRHLAMEMRRLCSEVAPNIFKGEEKND